MKPLLAAAPVLLAAACAAAGCCASSPRVFDYPGLHLRVVAANPAAVDRACRAAGRMEFDDDGVFLSADRRINGCWCERDRTIYVNWEKPEVLFHELCHAAGLPRKRCAGVRWEWY